MSRQGFVAEERLPSGSTCFKLRFRTEGGRQRVVYIGTDEQVARAIRDALTVMQAERRLERESGEAVREATRVMSSSMKTLAPLFANRGLVFHGRAIRRRRKHDGVFTEDPRNG